MYVLPNWLLTALTFVLDLNERSGLGLVLGDAKAVLTFLSNFLGSLS